MTSAVQARDPKVLYGTTTHCPASRVGQQSKATKNFSNIELCPGSIECNIPRSKGYDWVVLVLPISLLRPEQNIFQVYNKELQ